MKKRVIDPQDKMEKVIHAARKLFVEKGYHGVSVPEIVKASGVSVGAIYLHFGNKENLASSIYKKTLDEFLAMFTERLAGKDATQAKLRAFSELTFDITEEDPDMMAYMLTVRPGSFPDCSAPLCSTKPFLEVQRIVAEGIASGEIKPGNYLLAAVSYTGVIVRAVELRLQGVLQDPLPELADELIENAWASIRAV
ncbi:MAG: TetR/AcrR family transcriptional regulator [Desulfuromonas sp.]|nr:MAG: TetR/AcrR family transcriptional regulator [Desulfuromonas sp.]